MMLKIRGQLFSNIGNDLASKKKYQRQNDYSRYLNKSINSVFTVKPVEAELISKTKKNLPNKNSCGCDRINTNLLKIIEPAITKYLTILINQVLHVGVFHDKLKIAKVIPIYKKGDKRIFGNYRPISFLPTISNVLEIIIYDQFSSYLKENKLLFDHQYVFQSKHSTEFATLELID